MDHIYVITQVIGNSSEYNQPLQPGELHRLQKGARFSTIEKPAVVETLHTERV